MRAPARGSRPLLAFPYLPIDDVPQRVAGFGATYVQLRPTADGTGVTGGAVMTTPPPIRIPGASGGGSAAPSGFKAPLTAIVQAAQAQVRPTMQPIVPLSPFSQGGALPAPPAPVYAPEGGTQPSAGNTTALLVGAVLLVVVVGAYVATRKKG